jgi:uncharacterized membrane protein HdeD (DUF308 family)
MSTTLERLWVSELRHELTALRDNWFWFVLLGIAMVVLGAIALGSVVVTTVVTAMVFGVVLVAGGVVETIGAFWSRRWSGFFFHLLCGVLSIVVGMLFMYAPANAIVTLTLLLACFLLVDGIFTMATSLIHRFTAWGWALASGIADLVLGVLILQAWPASGLVAIGLYVGISLIFRGFNWIGLGLALNRFPAAPAA